MSRVILKTVSVLTLILGMGIFNQFASAVT